MSIHKEIVKHSNPNWRKHDPVYSPYLYCTLGVYYLTLLPLNPFKSCSHSFVYDINSNWNIIFADLVTSHFNFIGYRLWFTGHERTLQNAIHPNHVHSYWITIINEWVWIHNSFTKLDGSFPQKIILRPCNNFAAFQLSKSAWRLYI